MQNFNLITIFLFLCASLMVSRLSEQNQRQYILDATVMISIKTPNWQRPTATSDEPLPIPPDEYRTMGWADGYVVAEGLGTLVAHGDETLLVTHDHWSRFDERLGTVTFRNAGGTPLAEIDLHLFKQHLRYRDGGTMILTAPEVLAIAIPATAKALQTNALSRGDSVLLVQRAGGRVVLKEASVVAQSEKQGRPVVRLQCDDGQTVVGGDSGGGVWLNGRLVGTMWTTVMMEDSGKLQPTGLSVAALYSTH